MSGASPASARALTYHDILLEVAEYLDPASLYPFLLTSKACAIAVLPRLYRSYTITPNVPSTLLDLSPQEAPTAHCPPWSKRQAWARIRTLNIPTHSATLCAGKLPELPHLQRIHLSGGSRPLDMGSECKLHECCVLRRYSQTALTRLTLRRLDSLPPIPVTSVRLVLRPCEFPFDWRGEGVVSSATFAPLEGVREVDLVIWDEEHEHRLDWVHHRQREAGPWCVPKTADLGSGQDTQSEEGTMAVNPDGSKVSWARLPKTQEYRTKGCHYCDQRGCVRYSPNMPKQLAGVLYSLTRFTTLDTVRVWNALPALRRFQWWDSKMTDGECVRLARSEAERGWRERRKAGGGSGSEVGMEAGPEGEVRVRDGEVYAHDGPVLELRSGKEWAEHVFGLGWRDLDLGEGPYWSRVMCGPGDTPTLDDSEVDTAV